MKKIALFIGLLGCVLIGTSAVHAAHVTTNAVSPRVYVVTNMIYVVTNEYHNVYTTYENVVTQTFRNVYYYTNYVSVVTNIFQTYWRTNMNVNVIFDNFEPWVLAASNSAVNAQSAASSAASSSSSAWAANSSAYSFKQQAAASASAAANAASDGMTAINERVNWFDNHVIEAIRNANTLSNMNVVIDAPGASATYTYLTQRIDSVEAQWNTTKTDLYSIAANMTNELSVTKTNLYAIATNMTSELCATTNALRIATNRLEELRGDVSELAQYTTNNVERLDGVITNLAHYATNNVERLSELAQYVTNNIERIDIAITNLAQAVSNDMQSLEDRLIEYVGDRVSMSTAWATGTRITLTISTFRNISQNNKVASGACLESPATLGSHVYTATKAENINVGSDYAGHGYPSQYMSISPVGWYQGNANIRLVLRYDFENGAVQTNWLNTGVASASGLFKTTAVTRSLSGNNLYGGKDSTSTLVGLSGTLTVSPHGTY